MRWIHSEVDSIILVPVSASAGEVGTFCPLLSPKEAPSLNLVRSEIQSSVLSSSSSSWSRISFREPLSVRNHLLDRLVPLPQLGHILGHICSLIPDNYLHDDDDSDYKVNNNNNNNNNSNNNNEDNALYRSLSWVIFWVTFVRSYLIIRTLINKTILTTATTTTTTTTTTTITNKMKMTIMLSFDWIATLPCCSEAVQGLAADLSASVGHKPRNLNKVDHSKICFWKTQSWFALFQINIFFASILQMHIWFDGQPWHWFGVPCYNWVILQLLPGLHQKVAAKREAPEFPRPRQTSINQAWRISNGYQKFKFKASLEIRNLNFCWYWRSEIY